MVSNKVSLQNQLQNPALVTLKNLMRHLTARFVTPGFKNKTECITIFKTQSGVQLNPGSAAAHLHSIPFHGRATSMALFGCALGLALVNSATLTANYGVKQSQFTKPTSEPRASDPEESNEAFDRAIRGWLL